jgi:hypothetical protein
MAGRVTGGPGVAGANPAAAAISATDGSTTGMAVRIAGNCAIGKYPRMDEFLTGTA